MTFESILHPYSLLFLASFCLGVIGPHFHGRRKMMAFKFGADSLGSIYYFLLGAQAGGYGAMIASTGALVQALTPQRHLKKTVWLRMSVAVILSIVCIFLSYNKPSDLLPILMVIICRFGELQSKSQNIRIIYLVTGLPWMAYHIINGLYLPFFVTLLNCSSLLASILKHHYRKVHMHDQDGTASET